MSVAGFAVWTRLILVAGSPQMTRSSVWKLTITVSAIASGGSSVSWSVTFEPSTVSVHVSFRTKSLAGSSTNEVGPPETLAG
jgi:hypothetical protein